MPDWLTIALIFGSVFSSISALTVAVVIARTGRKIEDLLMEDLRDRPAERTKDDWRDRVL